MSKKDIVERVYSTGQDIDHDLFKLESAEMLKNISSLPPPTFEPTAHCHFFHTVDSDGRKQELCAAVGGHFHKMEVINTGGVPIVKCGPPIKWGTYKDRYGNQTRALVRFLDDDNHTHEVRYLKSEKIKLRSVSIEATKIVAADANRISGMPSGVV